jgi:gliding motility-associated transport system permease protein
VTGLAAVYRRELAGYFGQPVAYIVITAYLLICGWFFTSGLFLIGQADVRGYLEVAPTILVFFAPALTMRLLAEEWKNGTMELLLTLPVRDTDVVLGKYLAAFTVLVVAQALTLAYPLTVGLLGPMDVGQVVTGYVGLLLLGGAFLAVGVLASALTSSQVVAFIVSFFVCFGLFLLGKSLPFMPTALLPLLDYLAVDTHFANLTKGVVDSRDVLYFLTIVLLCLAGTVHALQGRKWGR